MIIYQKNIMSVAIGIFFREETVQMNYLCKDSEYYLAVAANLTSI